MWYLINLMFTVCFQHFNRLKNWVCNIPENICHLEKVTLTCNLCRKKDLWIGVLVWHIPQAFQTWVLKQPQRITQGDAYIPHYRCYFVAFLKSVSNWIICMNNILETVPYFLKPISGNGNICPIPPGACVWHPSWPNDSAERTCSHNCYVEPSAFTQLSVTGWLSRST